ncbi:RNA methyltransferase [Arenimonas terrae]|jgi:tRNA (cytidine32/uridine32-2'-O)-methyltransferase|uniref:tRNA (cytidine/uridine-2'-O-)-methyltransferase TrmJ n=1 Tax=Arenimonas terrae TaxID=2546226 RepID=A0A5C4RVT9_9GAMM|nr:RNA methyltransferase [Arenimonas terrae]TNJ35290.1 RNA methyltransferase [Arenimonas terrae]
MNTLPNLRIVLVGTQHPGNIGSAARAMKTMGLSALHLVAPERFPDPEANTLAAGADDLLAGAAVHADLDAALAGCTYVLGTSARRRHVPLPELSPQEAARQLVEAAGRGPVALLFGRERTGLENEELQRCHASVGIPTNPDFSSLNLAAAVQVLAYELRLALLAAAEGALPSGRPMPAPEQEPPATADELERFFGHMRLTLDEIDFHKGRPPEMVMARLRRLYLRAGLDSREVKILRGILSEAQRMARLARDRRT